MEVRKTVLVGHSAERMFDLIEAAERYPDFLPWCAAATIVERDDAVVIADITVDYHGVRFHFRTRNPKRRPGWMAIHLERGPFQRFHGEWQLAPLSAEGCRIEFELRYDFESAVMGKLAGPVFDRIADTLVDAFVAHAERVYATDGARAAETEAPAAREAAAPADPAPQSAVPVPAPPIGDALPTPIADSASAANAHEPFTRSEP